MKKVTSLFLALLMIFSSIPFSVSVFAEEGEAEEEIIPVYTIEDLYAINNNMSGHYVLMNDIDMTEATAEGGDWDYMGNGWDPIGSGGAYKDTAFTGVFDGNGYEIVGMRIDISESNLPSGVGDMCIGLFSKNNGTIKNLGISGGEITVTLTNKTGGSYCYIGSVVGYNKLGTIENCYNSSPISASVNFYYAYAGGLTGRSRGIIKNCHNTKNVSVTSKLAVTYSGGICGDTGTSIENCYNTGDIFSYNEGVRYKNENGIYIYSKSYSGGICGGRVSSITNSYNIGNVYSECYGYYSSNYSCSGGILGSSGNVESCYSIGNITRKLYETSYSGRAIAGGGNSDSVYSSYYLVGTGDSNTGAKALTEAQMKLATCYTGFDFENTWFIDNSSEYKYPQLISNPQNTTKEVTDISVNISLEKTSYLEGEAFDESSFEIIATYADGTTGIITDYTVSGFTGAVGENIITVTYKDKTATFTVKVHTPEEILAVAPTCTGTGLTSGVKCSNCGEILVAQTVVDANGHTVFVDKAVAPTCTTTGLTEGSHCDVCKEVLVAQEVIGTLEHTDTDSDGICDDCNTDTPNHDHEGEGKCDCLCHKTSFLKYIYKLIRIIWYLFSTNQYCGCGEAHY